MTPAYEVNFDGLIGPTHNYCTLSWGNRASMDNWGQPSNPKAVPTSRAKRSPVPSNRTQMFAAMVKPSSAAMTSALARSAGLKLTPSCLRKCAPTITPQESAAAAEKIRRLPFKFVLIMSFK